MIPVSQAFKDAGAASVSEPKLKVLGIFPDVAVDAQGATVLSATDEFSDDFPKEGAIDGDPTHINYGAPTAQADGGNGDGDPVAEDGIGGRGWRSASAALGFATSSKAEFQAETQTAAKAMGNKVECAYTSVVYEGDFDALAVGTLVGKDGWVDGGGTGNITVAAAAGYLDGQGVRMLALSGTNKQVNHDISTWVPGNFGWAISFRLKPVQLKGTLVSGTRYASLILKAGAAEKLRISWFADRIGFSVAGGAIAEVDQDPAYGLLGWGRFDLRMVTTAGVTYTSLWWNGREILQTSFVAAGTDTLCFKVVGAGGDDTEFYLDDVRMGILPVIQASQDHVVDLGATFPAVSDLADLSFVLEQPTVEDMIEGSIVPALAPTAVPLTNVTRHDLAQTFQVAAKGQIDAATLRLSRSNGLPTYGHMWVEIRTTRDPGTGIQTPDKYILGKSRGRIADDLAVDPAFSSIKFDFPYGVAVEPGIDYALVLAHDTNDGGARWTNWFKKAGGGMANGAAWSGNGEVVAFASAGRLPTDTAWTILDAGVSDFGFCLSQKSFSLFDNLDAGTDEKYIRGSAAFDSVAQAITLTRGRPMWGVQVRLKSIGAFTPGGTIWAELQGSNAGVPDGVAIAQSARLDVNVLAAFFRTYHLAFTEQPEPTSATQYFVVLRSDIPVDGANYLAAQDIANDLGIGNQFTGTAALAWTDTGRQSCMAFRFENKPYCYFQCADSADNITYSAFRELDNNERMSILESGEKIASGLSARYWKFRAVLLPSLSQIEITPTLLSWGARSLWAAGKNIAVDLGQARLIDRIEIYAHPKRGGCRQFNVAVSNDGAIWTTLVAADYDTALCQARVRGGGASAPTIAALGHIVVDGDFIGLQLATQKTTRYLKVSIYANTDEWARILELRAFRTVDLTDRLGQNCSISQDSDYLLRQVQAKTLTLEVSNEDGEMSSQNTAGSYYPDLGAGMRFLVYSGWQSVAGWIPRGVFYLDGWSEQTGSPMVRISGKDGVKVMSTQVQAYYKSNYRHWEVIEYLANLAGIPSQDMNLDRTSSRVAYFATAEVDAYTEAKDVALASGTSQLYFDANGYLNFRATGNTASNTFLDTAVADVPNRVWGKPVLDEDGKIHVWVQYADAASAGSACHNRALVFDPEDGTWAQEMDLAGTLNGFGLLWQARGDRFAMQGDPEVYSAAIYSLTVPAYGKVYKVDSTGTALAAPNQVLGNAHAAGFSLASVPFTRFDVDPTEHENKIYYGNGYKAVAVDKLTFLITEYGFEADNIKVVKVLSSAGSLFIMGAKWNGSTWDLNLYTWKPRETPALLSQLNGGLTSYAILGAAVSGGFVFYSLTEGNAQLRKADLATGVSSTVGAAVDTDGTGTGAVGALAVLDNADVFFAMGQGGTAVPRCGYYSDALGKTFDLGKVSMAGSGLSWFMPVFRDGLQYLYMAFDGMRLLEVQFARDFQAQAVAQVDITTDPDGTMVGSTLEAGDEAAGESLAVNFVIVKSNPLVPFPAETVWKATGVPMVLGAAATFPIELSEPCVPSSLVGHATLSFGAPAVTLTSQPRRTDLTVSSTLPGASTAFPVLTALYVDGQPLREAGVMVSILAGGKLSINRYGKRRLLIENNYIYDPMSQSFVGLAVLMRSEDSPIRVRDVQMPSMQALEQFDRIRVKDEPLNYDRDAYIMGIASNLHTWEDTLQVVLIPQ